MTQESYDVIVIGGGPAGMIAAGRAAELGKKVLLLERNNVLGVKLRLSGNGRCNLTNATRLDHFTEYYPDNPKFLHNAFNEFFNQDLIRLLNKFGLKVKIENKNRVFPVSDKSGDVVQALVLYLQKGNVDIKCRTLVTEIVIIEEKVRGVKTEQGTIFSGDRVVIATGGKSYPRLGSNGSGYQWAKKCGHDIIRLRPGLVGIEIKEAWVKKLQGLSISNSGICIYANTRIKKKIRADIVFAHYGISGPGAFDLSMYIPELLEQTKVFLKVDLSTDYTHDELITKTNNLIQNNPRLKCKNINFEHIPKKLINICLDIAAVNGDKSLNQLTKKEKMHLINTLKSVQLTVQRLRPLKEAMVTRGGVSIKEIDPNTMESKIVNGLYFCGEIIDIAGLSGGFNLQAAFSTGYVAGTSSSSI